MMVAKGRRKHTREEGINSEATGFQILNSHIPNPTIRNPKPHIGFNVIVSNVIIATAVNIIHRDCQYLLFVRIVDTVIQVVNLFVRIIVIMISYINE